jgi:hypothetical protein
MYLILFPMSVIYRINEYLLVIELNLEELVESKRNIDQLPEVSLEDFSK